VYGNGSQWFANTGASAHTPLICAAKTFDLTQSIGKFDARVPSSSVDRFITNAMVRAWCGRPQFGIAARFYVAWQGVLNASVARPGSA